MSVRSPQHFAEAAEELGTIAVQLLHPLRQRRVEARAQGLDRHLLLGVALLRRVQRRLQCLQLFAQRKKLLVQERHLLQPLGGNALLVGQCQRRRIELVGGAVV